MFLSSKLEMTKVSTSLIISGIVTDFKQLRGNDVAKAMIMMLQTIQRNSMENTVYYIGLCGVRHCQGRF